MGDAAAVQGVASAPRSSHIASRRRRAASRSRAAEFDLRRGRPWSDRSRHAGSACSVTGDGVVRGGHGLADGVGQRPQGGVAGRRLGVVDRGAGRVGHREVEHLRQPLRPPEHRHRQRVVIAGQPGRRQVSRARPATTAPRGSSGRRRGRRGCARRPRRPGRGLRTPHAAFPPPAGSGIGAVQRERRPGDRLRPTASGTSAKRSPTAAWPGLQRQRREAGHPRQPTDVAGHGQHQPEAPLAETPQRGQRPPQRNRLVGTRQAAHRMHAVAERRRRAPRRRTCGRSARPSSRPRTGRRGSRAPSEATTASVPVRRRRASGPVGTVTAP